MAIQPPSQGPRLTSITGGRVDEPPRAPWRFTPTDRCKESLWQALMTGVLYGTFAHSFYRVFNPSDTELLDIHFKTSVHANDHRIEIVPRTESEQNKRYLQITGYHIFLEPTSVVMGIGIADLARQGLTGQRYNLASESLLHPIRTFRNLFDNCVDRGPVEGKSLIESALKRKNNPLRAMKFEAISWPQISTQDMAVIERHEGEQRQLMETGAALAAGGAVAKQASATTWSSMLTGALGSLLLPFFVVPKNALNSSNQNRLL